VSPDGEKRLVVFQRDCGATTGFSTHASLLKSGETVPNEVGNVFIGDTDHGAVPSGPGGGLHLNVVWEGSHDLLLSYHPLSRVFKAEAEVMGVNIRLATEF
jgi:hypothetical protein